MLIIHNVVHDIKDLSVSTYVAYEAPENCDIIQLIHDATLDYCLAQHRDGDAVAAMSYMDFIERVPNEFCEVHGFKKMVLSDISDPCVGTSSCVSSQEIKRQLKDRQAAKQKTMAMHKAFAALGRRLEPALRKSTAMANWTFFQVTKQMLLWAEEFANTSSDANPMERSFVDSKLAQVRQAGHMEPPRDAALPNV